MDEIKFEELRQKLLQDVLSYTEDLFLKVMTDPKVIKNLVEEHFAPFLKMALKEMDVLEFPLSVNEYAVLAGITPAAAYQRVHRNQVRYDKEGERVLISPKEVNEILKIKAVKYRRAAN